MSDRVQELLEANNRYLQRARDAEADALLAREMIERMLIVMPGGVLRDQAVRFILAAKKRQPEKAL